MAVSLVLEGDILTQLGLGVFKQRIAFVRRAEDEGHPPVQMAHYQALSNLELHVFSLGELSGTWVISAELRPCSNAGFSFADPWGRIPTFSSSWRAA